MKRFLTISIIASLLAFPITGMGCIWEDPTYNYYLFHSCPATTNMFEERTNDFWKKYSNGKYSSLIYHSDDIVNIARQKGDTEMVAYIEELQNYLNICTQLQETWNYPTKEELAERKAILTSMVSKCKAYRSTRLRGQYALLLMRAQMLLKDYVANCKYWTTTARRMPPSVYRDMMENIYANALFNTGHMEAACDIYARQGDWNSIKWMMRKHRNLAGIKALYEKHPNSPTLTYLVEDFVNNVQETQDQQHLSDIQKEIYGDFNEEWITTIGRQAIYTDEARQFIIFAQNVVKEGKTQNPCLWQTAIGTIMYLMNDNKKALAAIDKAMDMQGTDIMRDCARCIRAICSVSTSKADTDYEKYITGELQWLDEKSVNADNNNLTNNDGDYYLRMKERLIHRNLIQYYQTKGHYETVAYMLSMMNEIQNTKENEKEDESDYMNKWNRHYSTSYFAYLDKMGADTLIEYYKMLQAKPSGPLEAYLKKHVYHNNAYYIDLIATHLMAEGRFADAIPYLEQIPLEFLCTQNIIAYMLRRNYTQARWMGRQAMELTFDESEYIGKPINRNPKLDFCREVLTLTSVHNLSRIGSKERDESAYQLAVRYFQASCYGDCWYLTRYGHSESDTVRNGEKDFAMAAIKYLEESSHSKDINIRQQSLFGLAFIPIDPWKYPTNELDSNYNWIMSYNRKSRQWKAYDALNAFCIITNPSLIKPYVSRCDVLKEFRKEKARK